MEGTYSFIDPLISGLGQREGALQRADEHMGGETKPYLREMKPKTRKKTDNR